MQKTKKPKPEILRRNRVVKKSMQSVLMAKESLWWKRVVKEVGFELGVKMRELWMVRVVSQHRDKMWYEQGSQRQKHWEEVDGREPGS